MNGRQQFVDERGPVELVEYDDGTILLAADVGPGRDGSVDVVDGTAIVVTDDGQYDLDLPTDGEDAQAFIHNGVLTVEVRA